MTTLQSYLPIFPPDSVQVNSNLVCVRHDSLLTFYNASGPVLECDLEDSLSVHYAAVHLTHYKCASTMELVPILELDRTTIFRLRKKWALDHLHGLFPKKRGRKTSHKLTDETIPTLQQMLYDGSTLVSIAEKFGVTEGAVRRLIKKGVLMRDRSQEESARSETFIGGSHPSDRSRIDKEGAMGVGTKRIGDRVFASLGKLQEAQPQFSTCQSVANAGVLLALPFILQQGLLDVGCAVYKCLKKGFYGLQSILLVLVFLALLRIKTPDQLTGKAPGELGLLLGLDRVPGVKTLRRKLLELGSRHLAYEFSGQLLERWFHDESFCGRDLEDDKIGVFYLDGHIQVYHGRKHSISKRFVQQRRLAMPGYADFWVHQSQMSPVFFVTAKVNDGLLTLLDTEVIPRLLEEVPENLPILLVFDREGWSPDRFQEWKELKVFVLTYRKGSYDAWSEREFTKYCERIDGKAVEYDLCERPFRFGNGLEGREIRRLRDGQRQTSIITTCPQFSTLEMAYRMFSRWGQENYFQYMKHEYALDHLITYVTEPGCADYEIPNPETKRVRQELAKQKKEMTLLKSEWLDRSEGKTVRKRPGKPRLSLEELRIAIDRLEEEMVSSKTRYQALPDYVLLRDVLSEESIVQHEQDRNHLIKTIKMLTYRCEMDLIKRVTPFLPRIEEDGHRYIRSVLAQPGDFVVDKPGKTLTIRYYSMDTTRSNKALQSLCDSMNQISVCFPGTKLKIKYEML